MENQQERKFYPWPFTSDFFKLVLKASPIIFSQSPTI